MRMILPLTEPTDGAAGRSGRVIVERFARRVSHRSAAWTLPHNKKEHRRPLLRAAHFIVDCKKKGLMYLAVSHEPVRCVHVTIA
jgi:hypothetical protein